MHYQYRCKDCKMCFIIDVPTTFRVTKSINTSCPKCKSKNVVKLITRPNVIFKGTGWGKDKK